VKIFQQSPVLDEGKYDGKLLPLRIPKDLLGGLAARDSHPGEHYNPRVPHPAYKDHPLWREAMELVVAAYALADEARPVAPAVARTLRKAAVAIPSCLADALADEPERQIVDDRRRALGALAEIERQTLLLPVDLAEKGDALAGRARKLYREVERLLSEVKEFS